MRVCLRLFNQPTVWNNAAVQHPLLYFFSIFLNYSRTFAYRRDSGHACIEMNVFFFPNVRVLFLLNIKINQYNFCFFSCQLFRPLSHIFLPPTFLLLLLLFPFLCSRLSSCFWVSHFPFSFLDINFFLFSFFALLFKPFIAPALCNAFVFFFFSFLFSLFS
ncbi:uncharacterized protein TEOVI_000607500 [Trypanosoma equiperdum]|uniref:Uncharacterized protein n=2 Tax=Trypanozoon TaxID=39700 RepID=Q57Y58_TRYB2|nr:hypothetical protein Tb927.7.6710 [Trypanosoma brucei brucei TREU927]AAX69461.1 hypothetical protein Tb927.7.6710 [Trypanosoma brucei]AAZ12732.1 hypothetical protein Tb927.7.6710 [Trypanosoma brucei brucei TREU927]SCU68644.1 hypothetical protein, conserved [Trypanosoma equiperdum]